MLPVTGAVCRKAEDKNMLHDESEYILLGGPSGCWSICAVADPNGWHDTQRDDARWLDLVFDGGDWVAVFCDTLGVFNFAAEGRIPARNHEQRAAELSRRSAESFAQATAQYPMLARLDDTYEDVIYKREEVAQLREECLKLLAAATNPEAINALTTLITACDEALRLKFGLFFACP
jgi:hypothetical protein